VHALLSFRIVEYSKSHAHVDLVNPLRLTHGETAEAFMLFGLTFDVVLRFYRSAYNMYGLWVQGTYTYRFGRGPNS